MPEKSFYFDTSIWLDFLEKRDEPNMPKSEWALKLVDNITNNNDTIVYSDLTLMELKNAGYSIFEVEDLFSALNLRLFFVEATREQFGKGKDLSYKRQIPKGDAIHALIARDNRARLITFDKHFEKLQDIIKVYNPKEIMDS